MSGWSWSNWLIASTRSGAFRANVEDPTQILAQETRDIYAPLAGRLGIEWIKQELEDLAFRCLEPEAWEKIRQGLAKTEDERRRYIDELKEILTSKMEQNGIRGRISGRPKHLYSIHLKMLRQDMDLHRIYDLIAFRIVVDSVTACYEALAMVHAAWEPVAGRYKDYIAKPKSNMYQSLHTTVVGPHHEHVEIQIRTEDMHKVANEGIAAHWLYKEGAPAGRCRQGGNATVFLVAGSPGMGQRMAGPERSSRGCQNRLLSR